MRYHFYAKLMQPTVGLAKLRETTMRQFTISAAAATVFAALLASAPAQADILNGASAKNGNQCFKFSTGNERDSRFGSWGACPQTASVAVAPRHVRRHHSSSR
jgi:uncharacterized membrane protein